MDAATTNLLNTYLDCVKILVNEPWPDNMEDVLDVVIQNTKTFSEKIKSRKRKSKINKNDSSKTCTRKVTRRSSSRCAKSSTVTLKEFKYEGPSPVVLIKRMIDEKNAADSNNGGAKVDNQSANKKLKSTRQDKDNAHASANEIKPELVECNRTEEDLSFREDEEDNALASKNEIKTEFDGKGTYGSGCKSDGCVIN